MAYQNRYAGTGHDLQPALLRVLMHVSQCLRMQGAAPTRGSSIVHSSCAICGGSDEASKVSASAARLLLMLFTAIIRMHHIAPYCTILKPLTSWTAGSLGRPRLPVVLKHTSNTCGACLTPIGPSNATRGERVPHLNGLAWSPCTARCLRPRACKYGPQTTLLGQAMPGVA